MALSPEDVATVARLARLHVAESNRAVVGEQLNRVLEFVEQLSEVNTDGVEPLTSIVETVLPMRDDRVTDGNNADAVTANAPQRMHNFFVVPKVVE